MRRLMTMKKYSLVVLTCTGLYWLVLGGAESQRGKPQPQHRHHRFDVCIENWKLKILNLQL
jgi:hypothetical protein